jgi:aminoglycoside phosphotransferase family enzyme
LRGEGVQLLQRHLLYFQYLKTEGERELIGKTASNFHTPTKKKKIIHQIGEKTGRGKINNKSQENMGNLTPTKRKLIQNQNLQTLIATFESSAVESTLIGDISESPAKRRKYELMTEVVNPIGQGHGDGVNK